MQFEIIVDLAMSRCAHARRPAYRSHVRHRDRQNAPVPQPFLVPVLIGCAGVVVALANKTISDIRQRDDFWNVRQALATTNDLFAAMCTRALLRPMEVVPAESLAVASRDEVTRTEPTSNKAGKNKSPAMSRACVYRIVTRDTYLASFAI